MRLLVTGGAGFIGSHFVRRQLATPTVSDALGEEPDHGEHVVELTVFDALTYAGNKDNLAEVAGDPRYRFVHGDIADPDAVAKVVPGHDAIVNFAAESHVDRSIAGPAEFVRTNVLGTQVLLEAARAGDIGRFLQVSTDEVYGSISSGSWDENSPLAPNSPYAASKAAADLVALAYARTYDLDVVLTRGSNTYGPRQHPEKLIPLFITKLIEGRTVPLYGDGGNSRDWLHVDDHCRGIELALLRGRSGAVYHVGGGTEPTNLELTNRLLEAMGAGPDRIEQVQDRRGHDRRYALDSSRAEAELGYVPRTPFESGLAETVQWYRDNRPWWELLKARR